MLAGLGPTSWRSRMRVSNPLTPDTPLTQAQTHPPSLHTVRTKAAMDDEGGKCGQAAQLLSFLESFFDLVPTHAEGKPH